MRLMRSVITAFLTGLLMATTVSPRFAASAASDKAEYRIGDRLPQTPKQAPQSAYKEVAWDALLPPDWDPMRFFKGLNLDQLSDGDPRAMEALDKLREEWNKAPANPSMNGARIRIPGFVVPLENQRNQITEFLLVPYFGACIHVPPPPANQLIHVFPSKPLKDIQTMQAVWVSGTVENIGADTSMGRAGYRMKAEIVAPYKSPR
jgi:hypothetical protein